MIDNKKFLINMQMEFMDPLFFEINSEEFLTNLRKSELDKKRNEVVDNIDDLLDGFDDEWY